MEFLWKRDKLNFKKTEVAKTSKHSSNFQGISIKNEYKLIAASLFEFEKYFSTSFWNQNLRDEVTKTSSPK